MIYDSAPPTKPMASAVNNSAALQLVARLPINPETQYIPITSRYHQQPKWYQFIPRCMLMRPWLEGLLPAEPPYNIPRKGLIVADEGGVGKTKAAAICISHIYSLNPEKPILLLVPSRLIRGWMSEIIRVNPKLYGSIEISSNASKLTSVNEGKIYITSKDSFSKHSKSLFKSWRNPGKSENLDQADSNDQSKQLNKLFSLVVIDEAHKGKAGTGKDNENEESFSLKNASQMYIAIQKLCRDYSAKNLAITASPLSMELSDVKNIASMIDVSKPFLEPIGSNLKDDDNKFLLKEWEQYILQLRKISSPLKKQVVSDEELFEFFEFFSDTDNRVLIKNLPHYEELIEAMGKKVDSTGWKDYNKRMELINELNPYSAFLTIVKRQDLGEEANQLFRERVTWTEHIKLHDSHMSRLNEQPNKYSIGTGLRQIHEWPTNQDPDGNLGIYEGAAFDELGESGEILEPRLDKILHSVIPKDPVLSGKSKGNKGALIFCYHIRTVEKISMLLNNQKIQIGNREIKIQTHPITSETQNSMGKIQSLGSSSNQRADVYHVVVGTRAIQEGISMNWASTVIHWDLPTNPQTLEQRTWRLDRHRTDEDSDIFNTVYIVTDSDSDKVLVKTILDRAKTTDIILGHEHKPIYWPTDYSQKSEEIVRSYNGTETRFFYAESIELAKAWNLMVECNNSTDEFLIRTEQQKNLFSEIFQHFGLPGNIPEIKQHGVIEFDNWNRESRSSLQRLFLFADGMDLISLQKCFPVSNGRKNILSIDGFENKSEEKGRRFAISLDPQGKLLKRILRRVTEENQCISGDKESSKSLVFSIETKDPIKNHSVSFQSLYNSIYSTNSGLFVVENFEDDLGGEPLTYSSERFALLRNTMKGINDFSSVTITENQQEIARLAFDKVIEVFKQKLDADLIRLDSEIERLEIEKDSLEDSIYSSADSRRFERLNHQLQEKKDEYNSKLDIELNLQIHESKFYPVVRYVQGGI